MAAPTPNSTLLKDVFVLDVDADVPAETSDIHIEAGHIVEIGRDMSVSGDTGIVDGQGRYALPGLIDCHVHPFLSETDLSRLAEVPPTLMTARAIGILEGMLMRGFTSVRDAAGADWGIRKAVEDGVVVGPRLYIAGCALSQTGGHGDFRRLTEETSPCSCAHALAFASRIADGVDEVRKAVRDELRKGADQIKIMVSGGISSPHDPLECDQYSPEEIRVIVSEAERRGTYVMAHAYGASAIKTALECGVRSIEHGNLIDADSAKLAADKNAFLVPTLVTYEVLNDTTAQSGWLPGMLQKLQRVREAGLNAIELCQTHGVKLGFGTDLLGDSFEHQSREFTIRAQVQEPRDIIRSATRINAEIIQEQDRLGILKPGALADIILLNQNPFDDVEVFLDPGRHIPFVMKEGTIFKNQISERQ